MLYIIKNATYCNVMLHIVTIMLYIVNNATYYKNYVIYCYIL